MKTDNESEMMAWKFCAAIFATFGRKDGPAERARLCVLRDKLRIRNISIAEAFAAVARAEERGEDLDQ